MYVCKYFTVFSFPHRECVNNHLSYSVPYHPDTNSIEEFFSQLKHYIKKESPNTYRDIYKVISYKVISYKVISYKVISYKVISYKVISYKVISNILDKKITKGHLTNYLKHSYKI